MRTLTLRDGHLMPSVGLGTWKILPEQCDLAIGSAIKAGYRHFDCAEVYENEPEIGKALSRHFQDGSIKRSEVFITSKVWNTDHHYDAVIAACKKSLRSLQLQYLDLYLIHWPFAFGREKTFPATLDSSCSLAETWRAMQQLQKDGLVRSIGVSNFSIALIEQMMKDDANFPTKPAVNQFELHPFLPQFDLVGCCQKNGVVVTAYSSLGHASEEPSLLENPLVKEVAHLEQKSPAQALLCYGLMRGAAVIPKSVCEKRQLENLEHCGTLSEPSMNKLNSLSRTVTHRYADSVDWWGLSIE